jgi:succinyl-diaminopimelate desuccinylase
MDWHSKLKDWFSTHEQEGIDLLAELIRQDTVNPPGNEYRAAEIVEKYLARYDIDAVKYESVEGRTNLLASIGTGSPVVFVPAHTDVVPVGDGWDTDPFDPVIRDGYMYGRGTVDDKGPLASILLLAAFLSQHTDSFTGTFLLGAVADEEKGSTHGMVYLTENDLIHADMAIVPDTGMSIHTITCGEKGLLHIDITFTGEQAHGSKPEKELNAVWAAHAFLSKMHSLFGDTVGYLEEDADELFSPTTINIGKIHAGNAYNIIPAKCEIGLDIRNRPEMSSTEILARITQMCEEVHADGLCKSFNVKKETDMPPFVVDTTHTLIKAVTDAVEKIEGTPPTYVGMNGTTVCKQLIMNGIPAIGFSQNAHGYMHMANERIELSEIPIYGITLGIAFLEIVNAH